MTRRGAQTPISAAPAPAPAAGTYSLRGVQAALGLTRRIVSGLIDQGFVNPLRGPRGQLRFTFQDLLLLRSAHALQVAKIPPRRILQSLARLKATLPAELPLSGLRISAIGTDVAVRARDGRWQAADGQLLMDFDVAPAEEGSVTILDRAEAAERTRAPERVAGPTGERAQPHAPDGADAWFRQGEALEAADPAAAAAAYRRAIALEPGHAAAVLNLGALWSEAGRHADVAKVSATALAHVPPGPDLALILFNLGVALDHLERSSQAIAAYERALVLDPRLADAHYNLGRLLEGSGDARGALRHLAAYRRLQR